MSVPVVELDDVVAVLSAGDRDFDAGGERAGFSLLSHGLQCAAVLRELHADDLGLQIAGLVHDIGQTLTGNDDATHGDAGADFVRSVLGERVAELVRLHVPAKRYLVTVDPHYAAGLSPASVRSLQLQGGPMTAAEVEGFEALPYSGDAAELRRCDDLAKVADAVVEPLAEWLPRLAQMAGYAGSDVTVRDGARNTL